MFSTVPKVGQTSSSLPSEILERLQTEDDLLAILSTPVEATTEPQVPVTESMPDDPTLQTATPDTESIIAEIHHELCPAAAAAAAAAPPCLAA
ncbi:hypothetical protein LSAT2_007989, partial [Lamellibrachia satsuma]